MLSRIIGALPTITPGSGLPGQSLLTTIAGDLMTFVLVVSLIGLLLAAAAIAVGHHSQNSRLADRGRSALVASIAAALVAGAAVAVINFAFASGGAVH